MPSTTRHDFNNTSWHQKLRHNVKNTLLRQKYVMTSKKLVMMSKTRHDVKKFVMTSTTRHDVKKLVKHGKVPKRSSWFQKQIMVSTSLSRRQNYVMKSKFVVMSKIYERYGMTSQTLSYLKCQIRFLFPLVFIIFWHQFYISTMCRSRVINDYVLFTISVTLTVDLLQWYFSTIKCYTQLPYIKFCNNRPTYNEVTVWYKVAEIQIHRQTDKHQHYNLSLRD